MEMSKEKDINEILDMPYHYVTSMLEDENKPKRVNSVMDLP